MTLAFPIAALGTFVAVGLGSLAVAALALGHVVAPWGVFFFYALPALVFFAWTVVELAPARAHRCTSILPRRRPVASTPPRPAACPPDPAPRSEPALMRRLMGMWLVSMRPVMDAWRAPRVRRCVNAGFGIAALATVALVAHDLMSQRWPFPRTSVDLAAAAGALALTAAAPKALGWQRLFRDSDRPRSLALACATAAASVAGVALPSRFDDAVRVAIAHRLSGRRPPMAALVLSLFLLGMIDAGALAPFAAAAAVVAPVGAASRAGFALVAAAGVGAVLVVAALPRIRGHARLGRYALTRWLDRHALDSPADAALAWWLITAAWALRAVAIMLLMQAVGIPAPLTLALGYVTACAAVGALPIGPAGAATQAGVGAAMLASAGVGTREAIAFAVAAQALTLVTSVAVLAFAGLVRTAQILRPQRA
jgi:Lysylphosphatidylglycerol synthase TM region